MQFGAKSGEIWGYILLFILRSL